MIVRKSSLVLAATNNSLHSLPRHSTTSSPPPPARGTRPWRCPSNEYSTTASDASDAPHSWPETPKGHIYPTPYQIFDMKQDGKYSKAGYYKLAKIYHPDLHGNGKCEHGLSKTAKMERYRLIVAAHIILSDPVKRSAYDRFGAGWNGKAEVGGKETWAQPSPYHPAGPFSQSWQDTCDPIWQNATWEDWERFHRSRDNSLGGNRAPVYMKNSYFLAAVIALAIMGSSLNVNRAADTGTYLVEQRDIVHDRAVKNLRQARKEVEGLSNRQDRIDFFIRQREAAMGIGDLQALREEKAARLLKDRQVCASDKISDSNS